MVTKGTVKLLSETRTSAYIPGNHIHSKKGQDTYHEKDQETSKEQPPQKEGKASLRIYLHNNAWWSKSCPDTAPLLQGSELYL